MFRTMRVLKTLAVSFFFLLIYALYSNFSFSRTFRFELINPDSKFYEVKRFGEKVRLSLITKFSGSGSEYLSILLDRRFREILYLVAKNQLGELENSLARYNTTAGILLEIPKEKRGIKNIETYKLEFARIRDLFPANSSFWLFTQSALDTTNRL
ncbi:MAG: hypothetical protein UT72_C0005G0017 [Candidatus Woesebacteria bacterium GW2011_GWB1_40_101]|uniref:DUF5667 domain-containing protein n=1 Tax=Candidatus Woesebacteria bacterium GW2011_GWB1_40_101 TaxID=1618575 RepID=A0A0G0QQJ8_9BACT|nr:MAG: hypothetical protein UT72_C0005G0017 [Candidatus Woesebacteria bacterium GW2011_GWB1_40_101]